MDHKHVSLTNLARGKVGDMFARELKKCLENIADTRTSATKKRKITIEIVMQPNENRREIAYGVTAKCNVAEQSGIVGVAFASLDGKGEPRMTLNDPTQLELADQLAEAQRAKKQMEAVVNGDE